MTPQERLANAVIMQAVRDYRKTNNPRAIHGLETFFTGDWFPCLTSLDGRALLDRLREEKHYER